MLVNEPPTYTLRVASTINLTSDGIDLSLAEQKVALASRCAGDGDRVILGRDAVLRLDRDGADHISDRGGVAECSGVELGGKAPHGELQAPR